jgi:hypothetical protein
MVKRWRFGVVDDRHELYDRHGIHSMHSKRGVIDSRF